MQDKIKQIIDYLNDSIAEYNGYLNDPEYDDIEQHDVRVASDTCKEILRFINDLN